MAAMTITLTVSSAVGDDIVITSDGAGDYEIEAWDPRPLPIDNTYAESQTVDGADVSTSVRRIGSCQITVRCEGSDLDDAWLKATALAEVVEVDDGTGWDGDPAVTIVEDLTAVTAITHDCFRGSADIIRDPVLMEGAAAFRVQVTLPCWRRTWVQTPPDPP